MRLLSLVTTNFKKLGNFTADFTAGLNVIAGDNAKGKSTTLQAIEAALFGVTVVPGKKENIPTWGQTKFTLELKYELHDGVYTLTRNNTTAKLNRKNHDGTVELVANGNTPVTAAVEEMLGLAAKDWNLFVQSRQGSSAGILDFGATALNKKVEEFAGVDLIDKVQVEAQRQATQNLSHAEAKEVSEDEMKAAETGVEEADHYTGQAMSGVQQAKAELKLHGEFTLQPPPSSAGMRQQLSNVITLSNKITVAEEKVKGAQQRLDDAKQRTEGLTLQDDAEVQSELATAKEAGLKLSGQEKALQAELVAFNNAKSKADAAEKVLDEVQAAHTAAWKDFEPDEAEAAIEQQDKALKAAELDLAGRQEEVGKAKSDYDNLLMLSDGAVCPTCNRAKEDHDPVKLAAEAEEARTYWEGRKASVSELQTKIAGIKADLTTLRNTSAQYESAVVKLDSAIAAQKSAKGEMVALRADFTVQNELEGVTSALEESRTAYADLQAKLKGVSDNNARLRTEESALLKATADHGFAKQELKELEDQLEDMPEPPTDDEVRAAEVAEASYQSAHSDWKDKHHTLKSAVTSAEQSLKHQQELLNLAQEKLEVLKTRSAAALEHTTLAKKYSRLVQFLRERRQQYLKEVWDTVMGVSSRLVRTASKDLITKITNEEGEFLFEEDGIMAPTASASGAQKAMIGVSLRVGLARALYGKDSLLIFDEPTESCREHNAASLAAMIARSAQQVLLITHRETDQALAENIVNVGE